MHNNTRIARLAVFYSKLCIRAISCSVNQGLIHELAPIPNGYEQTKGTFLPDVAKNSTLGVLSFGLE